MTASERTVEEVLKRVGESLIAGVLPHVENHFAELQLRAACEMLLHIGVRVRWDDEESPSEAGALGEAVVALAAISADVSLQHAEAGSCSTSELRERFAALIGTVYDGDVEPERRELALSMAWRAIKAEFDANAVLLRTGMYA